MEFRVAKAARVTGAMLIAGVRDALRQANIPEPDAVVCYGVGYNGPKPCLNGQCDGNKYGQSERLAQALGNEALDVFRIERGRLSRALPLPAVARKDHHSKGRDMRLCRTQAGVQAVLRNGRHNFFTPVVPSDTEYRAWVYRRRVLAVYEKRLTEPQNNTKFGRNRANGWTFHALESAQIPEDVRRVAVAAVRALGLDFGAVDILGKRTPQGMAVTVLEVNSAPGVANEHRTAIVKLVKRVTEWVRVGCPARDAAPTETEGRRRRVA